MTILSPIDKVNDSHVKSQLEELYLNVTVEQGIFYLFLYGSIIDVVLPGKNNTVMKLYGVKKEALEGKWVNLLLVKAD